MDDDQHPSPLKGNNDLLCLTQPDAIRQIHVDYLRAGSDVIETNTFNATSISQGDYGTESFVRDINVAAARLAKEAADIVMKEDGASFHSLSLSLSVLMFMSMYYANTCTSTQPMQCQYGCPVSPFICGHALN